MKKTINLVWLKRDLRLSDHPPLYEAISGDEEFIVLFIYEPLLINDVHYDKRHWRFIEQSLNDIEKKLSLHHKHLSCLLYTSPSPRDRQKSRMPSSA